MEKILNSDKILANILKKIVFILIIISIIVMLLFSVVFMVNLAPVNSNSDNTVEFVLDKGWSQKKVLDELKAQGLIKNITVVKIYLKLSNSSSFLAGTYLLSPNMDATTIVKNLENGYALKNNTVDVKFIEGKRFVDYVAKISSTFGYSEEEIIDYASNPDYLKTLINKYWFITDEILNKNLYYPLEGYLFADTYTFKEDATIDEILTKMLDQTGEKLKIYEDEIKLSGMNVHSLLTLASMVELEAVTPEDRLEVSGIFMNRIKNNDTLGSDVTTYYAEQKKMSEPLKNSELNACNAYNTRGTCFTGLPVGPICSPSYTSIATAINPATTDNYYFVADTSNKLYFGVTSEDHQNNINYLIKMGIMPK